MELLSYLRELGLSPDEAYLREGLSMMMRLLMEIEVSRTIDALPYERSDDRSNYRNGYRTRAWRTRCGTITLHIPKLRRGTYTPGLIERSTEDVLLALLQEAYVLGPSQTRMSALLNQLKLDDAHPSETAALTEQLDDLVRRFRDRPLRSPYPYLWLDVVETPVSEGRRAVAVAVGVGSNGRQDVLGFEVGSSADNPTLWRTFLRKLALRGLRGVQLVISDSYGGVKAAVREVLYAEWQYSRAHALEDVLRAVPLDDHNTVAAAISTIFVQSTPQAAATQLQQVVDSLGMQWPQAAHRLSMVGTDLLAYLSVPEVDWVLVTTANVMQRVRQALTQQADAIGIFPPPGVMLLDAHQPFAGLDVEGQYQPSALAAPLM